MGGGGGAATVGNAALGPQTIQQELPSINQGYQNQFQQFGNFTGSQALLNYVTPLIQQASTGAQGFFGSLFGPGSQINSEIGNAFNTYLSPTSGISQGISRAQSEIASGGFATPEQARDTNQATLANASAAGSAFSPNTLGQLAINEDSARQSRVNTAYGQLGAAQGLQSGALGQIGAVQGLQTGGLNQLLGAAQGGVGALQGEVGAFTGLTDPILSFLSNMFGQNTQANIAQAQLSTQASLANQSKTGGAIGGGVSAIGSIAGAAL